MDFGCQNFVWHVPHTLHLREDSASCKSSMGTRATAHRRAGSATVSTRMAVTGAVYDGDDLVCVTVYRKGALEVVRRLSE